MNAYNYLLCAGITLLACTSVDNQEEQSTENKGNPNKQKPEIVIPASDRWASLADSCTYVLTSNFLNKTKGTFWSSVNNVDRASANIYWQQAHAMDVLLYSYQRIKESNPDLAKQYESYFRKWYDNDANNYNNTYDKVGEYGGFFNAWTDDMAWICLTLLKMSEFTGEELYAQTAKEVYDNYIWTRSTTSDRGVCLPWTNREEDKTKFNACTNTPACLLSSLLYLKFNEQSYLQNAKDLYNFNVNNMPDNERVEDPPLSYTQGTLGEAARVLYHITGDKSYMNMAGRVLMYCLSSNRTTNKGLLRNEGKTMDQSIFKAVFVPYAVNYVLDKDADKAIAIMIKEKLLQNAEALDKNLSKSSYPSMYANYYWGEPVPEGTLVSMGAQASGSSLIEGVARMMK